MTTTPGTSRSVLTARCPDDLIVLASLVLGFTPACSVVMLTFGTRTAFHARVDLPDPPGSPDELDEVAELLMAPAVRHGADRVVLLVFTDDAALGAMAWSRLRAAAAGCGVHVVEALRVTASHWYPYLARDPQARQVGVAYDVGDHRFLAEAVFEGRVVRASRGELAASLDPLPDAVLAVEAALSRQAAGPASGTVAQLRESDWARALVTAHTEARTRPDDDDAARLLRGVQATAVRDAVWALVSRPVALSHQEFWIDLVRRCPERLLPPPAMLAAFCAWQAGDGALAWCGIDRCGEVDPDYEMRRLLALALETATPPSQWQPVSPLPHADEAVPAPAPQRSTTVPPGSAGPIDGGVAR